MFGWTLIRKKRLEKLEWYVIRISSLSECRRWFSGFKDLEIIWNYVMGKREAGTISNARDDYAKARETDAYGVSKAHAALEIAKKHLIEAQEWSKLNEHPDHEVRYHLCVDVPGEAQACLEKIEETLS